VRYVLDPTAGQERIVIRGETYKYLIKVRRHGIGERVAFRHPDAPKTLHTYEIVSIDGRTAQLQLLSSEDEEIKAAKALHIGWCVVDAKSVEKVLPLLNELGVEKITFIYCERSQKNFKPDFKRYERILESSMQQCGRSDKMGLESGQTLAAFLEKHPETVVFDFCDAVFEGEDFVSTVLIGSEGGFSDKERELLKNQRMYRLDTPMILRSETAAVAVASKILL
jgi:16S rRNA (uracil1498-N3)-methyltransferase